MKTLLSILVFFAPLAFSLDREPDEIFLRHARDLIPQFLEEQARAYEVPLHVDLDSLKVEDLLASRSSRAWRRSSTRPSCSSDPGK